MNPNVRNTTSRKSDDCAVTPSAPLKCLMQCFLRETRLECRQSERWGQMLGRSVNIPLLNETTYFGWVFFCSFIRSGGAPFFLQVLHMINPFCSHFAAEFTHFLDQIKLILIQLLLQIADLSLGRAVEEESFCLLKLNFQK